MGTPTGLCTATTAAFYIEKTRPGAAAAAPVALPTPRFDCCCRTSIGRDAGAARGKAALAPAHLLEHLVAHVIRTDGRVQALAPRRVLVDPSCGLYPESSCS